MYNDMENQKYSPIKRLIATLDFINHALKFYRKHLIHKIISSHLITNEIVNIK